VTRTLTGYWLGRRRYSPIHELQEQLTAARREQRIGDTVLFLEHEPVITSGRGAKPGHVLWNPPMLAQAGVEFVETGRGGDVTLHLPGQLVCYPILDLSPDRRDVRRYVRDLTQTMRRVVEEYGLATGTIDEYIGLWADRESPGYWPGQQMTQEPVKLGAIGVKISRWVTMHGFALNVDPDLSLFGSIVPCGISRYGVGSLASLTGARPALRQVAERAFAHLTQLFDAPGAELREGTPALPPALQPEPA